MKLRMARNSIFAILLRSPWWASLAVAAALVVLGQAALPPAYAAFGLFAAIPFVLITAIVAWRQARRPSTVRITQTASTVQAMSWATFAHVLEHAFQRDGCEVKRLDNAHADFELARAGKIALVCARRWKAAHTGVEPLRDLQAARQTRRAHESLYVALGDFSPAARDYAARQNIRLVRAEELARLLPASQRA